MVRFTLAVRGLRPLLALAAMAAISTRAAARAETILFVGNSFTFAAHSPIWRYRAGSVDDLNHDGVGGAPALFKLFAEEAGLRYAVTLETSPGKDLQWHIDHRAPVIDRAWDHGVLQSFSTLDASSPGDPTSLVHSLATLAKMFHDKNAAVDIELDATWSRADLTYKPDGHWYGKPIAAMETEVKAG
jgi:hypothetical protein